MIKRMINKKIIIVFMTMFTLLLIYLIPSNINYELKDIPSEIEYVNKELNKEPEGLGGQIGANTLQLACGALPTCPLCVSA